MHSAQAVAIIAFLAQFTNLHEEMDMEVDNDKVDGKYRSKVREVTAKVP
jgi:hypothetical protein